MVPRSCAAVFWLLTGVAACACSTVAGPGSSASASPSSSSAAPAPASAAAPATGSAGARSDFHCFSWVHGPDFSTDCFRGAAICDRERIAMKEGARDTMECSKVKGASCTRVSRPPTPGDSERCFGDANNCERYRAYVQGNGLTVTPCEDR